MVPLSEAQAYDLKEKIPATRGKITRINDYVTGNTNGNAWAFQTFELCDPKDPKVRVRAKAWNGQEIPKTWISQIVHLECVEGERGPKGVTMEQDTYRWKEGQPIKKQIEIQCGDGAVFALAGNTPISQESGPAQNQPGATRQRPANAPQGTAPAQTASPAAASQTASQPAPAQTRKAHDGEPSLNEDEKRGLVAKAAKFVGRRIGGFRIIMRAMDKFAEERQKAGRPLTPEHYQAMCSSIFIDGNKVYMWENLPMTEELLEKYWPQPAKPANSEPAGQ